jgi:leukotriene-A4 hydrolase
VELPVKMEYDMTLAEEAYALAERWDKSRDILDLSKLDFDETDLKMLASNQISQYSARSKYSIRRLILSIVAFLDRLQSLPTLPSSHIIYLGKLYHLSQSTNAEHRLRFYEIAMADHLSRAAKLFAPEAARWVVGDDGTGLKGRMKFCRPIFKAVHKVDRELSVAVFSQSKSAFHPIARKLIEKVSDVSLMKRTYTAINGFLCRI